MGGLEQLKSLFDNRITVCRSPTNIGKGKIVRQHYERAMSGCHLDHFVGMDADIVVSPGWYEGLLNAAREVAPWAAMAPVIYSPGGTIPTMHGAVPGTREIRPHIWYNQATAGPLFLIRRKFWENWGGYPGDRLYGNDDGALCKQAVRKGLFVGYTDSVTVEHHNSDSDSGYRDWKVRNLAVSADPAGYWG